jgi:hypothetical protein
MKAIVLRLEQGVMFSCWEVGFSLSVSAFGQSEV